MANCKFESRNELNTKVLKGVNTLADNVAATLGPKGRNVILHQLGKDPFITKDGVTVSEFVHLDDEFEKAAAQIIKQATARPTQWPATEPQRPPSSHERFSQSPSAILRQAQALLS